MSVRWFFVTLAIAAAASTVAAQRIPAANAWTPGERFVVFEGFYNPG